MLKEIEREVWLCRVTKITKGKASRSLKGNVLTLRKEITDMDIGDIYVETKDSDPVSSELAPVGQTGKSPVVNSKLSSDQ